MKKIWTRYLAYVDSYFKQWYWKASTATSCMWRAFTGPVRGNSTGVYFCGGWKCCGRQWRSRSEHIELGLLWPIGMGPGLHGAHQPTYHCSTSFNSQWWDTVRTVTRDHGSIMVGSQTPFKMKTVITRQLPLSCGFGFFQELCEVSWGSVTHDALKLCY